MPITEWDVYITLASDTVVPRYGRNTTVNINESYREGVSANGTLKSDIRYIKRQFVFAYPFIKESDYDILVSIHTYYAANKTALLLKKYTSAALYDSYYVVPRIPSYSLKARAGSDNLLSGVQFICDEA